jgi:C-terminal processing protease CtpA/Prc
MKQVLFLLIIFLTYDTTFAQKSPYEKLNSEIQPQDLKSDIDSWLDWLHSTHPDLSYTIKDIDKFYKSVSQIKDSINSPLTVLEFWKRISLLNNQLSDGHLIVGHINAPIVKDYVSKGGTFFPFEVLVNKEELLIYSNLDGKDSEYKGYVITKINNIPIATIIAPILLRINGDSDAQRKVLLQRKFALFYMLLFGEHKEFSISLKNGNIDKTISINGLSALPKFYQQVIFDDNFKFKILDKENALLTINEFGWDNKKAYYDFMDSTFMILKQNKSKHLIIDIRENGGGDDEFWMKGILKYIANKPYRWGSTYRKKIIAKYRDSGEVIGSTITGKIDTLIPVEINNKYKFHGKVSVLIGPYTYSSAILFANTVQDYKFGQLIGEPTGGKSGQSGATQFSKMPNSGLTMITPRFYLERPKGGGQKEPVNPDIQIEYDKLNPNELIDALLRKK